MKDSLRAILFDFDGVLADSEPLHLEMFQKILGEEGVALSKEEYYDKYLGLDDRGCFTKIYESHGKALSPEKCLELIRRKNRSLLESVRGRSLLMPGVAEMLARLQGKYFLAIVSGALKSEIRAILEGAGVSERFHVMIGAEDVQEGKPHPEGFQAAIRILNRDFVPPAEILLPAECLVVEDSPWGIESAKAAGARCLALATSYDPSRLKGADLIAKDAASIPWEKAEMLFSQ